MHTPTTKTPFRLLVVDDEPQIRTMLARYFEKRGFRVTVASEVAEAAALVEHRRFDGLLTDLGFTALERSEGLDIVTHARYHAPGMRIVVFTGRPTSALEEACYGNGADAFLAKPQPLSRVADLFVPAEEVCAHVQ